MKITKQQAEILKQKIDEMTEEQKVEEWPKKGDRYWYLSSTGAYSRIWGDYTADNEAKPRGIFKTKKEAELADQRRVAEAELIEAIRKANEGWVPDWGACDSKHMFHFAGGEVCTSITGRCQYFENALCCKSREALEQVLEELGEEKIKLGMGW